MRVRVVAFASALGLASAGGASTGITTARYARDGWSLTVTRDAFAGGTRCLLGSRDRRVSIVRGAVGFRFRQRLDTLGASYRVDGGPAVNWRDRYPALVAVDAPIDGPGLDDPTGGTVWVPASDLDQAASITIRPTPRSRPRTFGLAGLRRMRASARALGCGGEIG